MKPKLIPQLAIVTAEDPATLQDKINSELMLHPNFTDLEIDGNRAIIRYDLEIQPPKPIDLLTGPDQDAHIDHSLVLTPENATDIQRVVVELVLQDPGEDRYCCECQNYKWGIGCPYREGRVKLMDQACEMFDVKIGYDAGDITTERPKLPEVTWEHSPGAPRYTFEWIGDPPDQKYNILACNDLTAEEISLAVYGKPRSISESKLISLAEKTGAAVLYKSMPFDTGVLQLYPKE